MPLPAYRAKQSTSTTGTGTLTLAAASATGRSLLAAYGAALRRVQYVISWATGFEIGLGDYDGGTPGTLTRATVLASSNAGALVSLPAGVKDVFIALVPGQRELLGITATATLAAVDLGGLVQFTGSSAATLNLPAAATVPPGAGVLVVNGGTAALTLDASGAELIGGATTVALYPGETCEIFRSGSGWVVAELPSGWRLVGSSVSASVVGAVAFALPATFQRFRLELDDFSPSASAAAFLRFSFDGGSSYAAGASDYGYAGGYQRAAGLVAMGATGTIVQISDTVAGDCFGTLELRPTGTKRLTFDTTATNATPALSRLAGSGNCSVAGTATHVQLGFVATTVATHRVRLLGIA